MKPYLNFSAEDFACDDDFLNWVKHPEGYPHLESFWVHWLSEHPEKQEIVEEARNLVLAVLADDQHFPDAQKQGEIWDRIQKSTDLASFEKVVPLWKRWYSRAAVLLFSLAVAWWGIDRSTVVDFDDKHQAVETHFVKHVNNADLAQTIVLSDGTSILLQPHGVLEYPAAFAADVREVVLTGEAFFQVARDPDRPFLVQSGDIITRVLGTSFSVRNVDGDGNVLVQVKTGKVSVFMATERADPLEVSDKKVEGVVLMPNQQVLYEKEAMKMTKSLVENPSVLVPPRRQNFEFSDTPIKEVFEAIEEAYGVEIVFDEQAFVSCFLNASLDDVMLHDKLRLICKAINATYEIMDSHIIVYGKGCREENEPKNPTTL